MFAVRAECIAATLSRTGNPTTWGTRQVRNRPAPRAGGVESLSTYGVAFFVVHTSVGCAAGRQRSTSAGEVIGTFITRVTRGITCLVERQDELPLDCLQDSFESVSGSRGCGGGHGAPVTSLDRAAAVSTLGPAIAGLRMGSAWVAGASKARLNLYQRGAQLASWLPSVVPCPGPAAGLHDEVGHQADLDHPRTPGHVGRYLATLSWTRPGGRVGVDCTYASDEQRGDECGDDSHGWSQKPGATSRLSSPVRHAFGASARSLG
jgi:hypothetical protein